MSLFGSENDRPGGPTPPPVRVEPADEVVADYGSLGKAAASFGG
jgi:hypothetical protein